MNKDLSNRLLQLLKQNSRATVTELAQSLGVTRATVTEYIDRLESTKVIRGYTVKIDPHYEQQRVDAYVMIAVQAKKAQAIVSKLEKMPFIDMLSTISGQYDLIAHVVGPTTEALDAEIDSIADLEGVERTLSHIVLSQKIHR